MILNLQPIIILLFIPAILKLVRLKQDGMSVANYVYDAWGNILSVKDGANKDVASTDTSHIANLNPYRYRGYIYNNETGLYYLQSRYYDPVTGRFINADVYVDTGSTVLSTNMFAYCENNTVLYSDTAGYWKSDDHVALCKKAGFGKTTQTWVKYADTKFSSDSKYSAPFHSRNSKPNAVYIAKYLYNKAINLIKQYNSGQKSRVTFKYTSNEKLNKDTKSTVYLDDYYLGFTNKTTYKKTTSNDKAKLLLKELNNLKGRQYQSYALLGLMLHTVQDYFAHLTKIDVYKNNKSYLKNVTTTNFSNNYLHSTNVFEENKNAISWRYNNTKKVTYAICAWYQKRKKINEIQFKQISNYRGCYLLMYQRIGYKIYSYEHILKIT